jgi:hypothetical protein
MSWFPGLRRLKIQRLGINDPVYRKGKLLAKARGVAVAGRENRLRQVLAVAPDVVVIREARTATPRYLNAQRRGRVFTLRPSVRPRDKPSQQATIGVREEQVRFSIGDIRPAGTFVLPGSPGPRLSQHEHALFLGPVSGRQYTPRRISSRDLLVGEERAQVSSRLPLFDLG